MRNPNWTEDELLLVINLYFENSRLDKTNPKVIEMSQILNRLPVHSKENRQKNFRNPNGVEMKLANLRRLDPDYEGEGLKSGGRLEEYLWNQYYNNKSELTSVVNSILQILEDDNLTQELESLGNLDQESQLDTTGSKEGRILERLHKYRERNSNLVKKKKRNVLNKEGRLDCEVCGFNFQEKYGDLGEGFIECHHVTPISQLKPDTVVTWNDLILVCSNCHRMIHRKTNLTTIEELRFLIQVELPSN